MRSAGNGLEPSGPTDPQLKIFTSNGTETATTDGARYQLTTGPAYPADDPQAAAASLRDRLHTPASHPAEPSYPIQPTSATTVGPCQGR